MGAVSSLKAQGEWASGGMTGACARLSGNNSNKSSKSIAQGPWSNPFLIKRPDDKAMDVPINRRPCYPGPTQRSVVATSGLACEVCVIDALVRARKRGRLLLMASDLSFQARLLDP